MTKALAAGFVALSMLGSAAQAVPVHLDFVSYDTRWIGTEPEGEGQGGTVKAHIHLDLPFLSIIEYKNDFAYGKLNSESISGSLVDLWIDICGTWQEVNTGNLWLGLDEQGQLQWLYLEMLRDTPDVTIANEKLVWGSSTEAWYEAEGTWSVTYPSEMPDGHGGGVEVPAPVPVPATAILLGSGLLGLLGVRRRFSTSA